MYILKTRQEKTNNGKFIRAFGLLGYKLVKNEIWKQIVSTQVCNQSPRHILNPPLAKFNILELKKSSPGHILESSILVNQFNSQLSWWSHYGFLCRSKSGAIQSFLPHLFPTCKQCVISASSSSPSSYSTSSSSSSSSPSYICIRVKRGPILLLSTPLQSDVDLTPLNKIPILDPSSSSSL